MDGEQKLMLMVYCVLVLCLTILYSFLFVSLWAYKELVGMSLLVVIVSVVVMWRVVDAKGKLNEQRLRQQRFRYREEIPLDGEGEPRYLPADAQENRYRMAQQHRKYEEYLYER